MKVTEAFLVTHVGPSDSLDIPGAIDADVELPTGWSVSVTLVAQRGRRGRWISWGGAVDWLSDPSEVAEADRGALVDAVNAAARAAGMGVGRAEVDRG